MTIDRDELPSGDLQVIAYSVGIWAVSLGLIAAFGLAMRLVHAS